MSGINTVTIVGRAGQDPKVAALNSGDKVCNFTVATSETWKDKNTGERREKTEWHA
jgi:single-strand DNA-binding protein